MIDRLSTCFLGKCDTYDQYGHHVVMMDTFLNANNSKNKDLREWNPRRSDEEDVVIPSAWIPLFQIIVSKVICILKRSITTWWACFGHKWKWLEYRECL